MTVSGQAVQEFSLLHNFIDAVKWPCYSAWEEVKQDHLLLFLEALCGPCTQAHLPVCHHWCKTHVQNKAKTSLLFKRLDSLAIHTQVDIYHILKDVCVYGLLLLGWGVNIFDTPGAGTSQCSGICVGTGRPSGQNKELLGVA